MAPKHHWGSKRNDVSSVPRALPFPWAARRRRHVLEIKSAGRCQWTQHTLFSKSIQKPTPSSDFIPFSSLFRLKHLENTLGTVKQIPEDSFIHSIHFPVLRNTMKSKQMITGRRTGISFPPWMRNRNARNLMWNAEEHTFSAMESKHSAIKPRPQIHPKVQAETEQGMQTCLQKGLTYTVYPLTATSCVGRKELKPSQVSPRRWLVGKQGRMQGNGCVSEYMLNGISSQETANNFGNREERNPQGQKSIGLTKTRQRPRPSSMKQEQISLVWLDLPFEGEKQAVGKCRQMWVSQQSRESGKKTKSCIRQNLSSSRLCAASQSTCSSWSQP